MSRNISETQINFDINTLVINSKLVKSKNSVHLQHEKIHYLHGHCGIIDTSTCGPLTSHPYITLVSNFNSCITLNNEGNETEIKDGAKKTAVLREFKKIDLKDESQLIFVSEDFYTSIGLPSARESLDTHIHERLILCLLDAILTSSNPIYEILAICNMLGVDNYSKNINCRFQKLKDAIEANALDEDFNLNALCNIAHMSRRKVQYILFNNNTTFLELVNDYRLSCLKKLLLSQPNSPVNNLVYKAGFRNYNTAGRLFKSKFELSIRDFKAKAINQNTIKA